LAHNHFSLRAASPIPFPRVALTGVTVRGTVTLAFSRACSLPRSHCVVGPGRQPSRERYSPFHHFHAGPTCHLTAASTTRPPCVDLSLASRGLGHVPDSDDSGDKSRARPRPPLLQPSCVLPSLIQSAAVPHERGWCGPPLVKLITGGRLSLARWPGASSHSPLSACGHPGRLRGRASG
jgi:hypothetical protein